MRFVKRRPDPTYPLHVQTEFCPFPDWPSSGGRANEFVVGDASDGVLEKVDKVDHRILIEGFELLGGKRRRVYWSTFNTEVEIGVYGRRSNKGCLKKTRSQFISKWDRLLGYPPDQVPRYRPHRCCRGATRSVLKIGLLRGLPVARLSSVKGLRNRQCEERE